MNLIDIESADLRDPGPRAVKKFQQAGVSQFLWTQPFKTVEDQLDLGDAQGLWQPAFQFWWMNGSGHIVDCYALLNSESVQITHGNCCSGNRCLCQRLMFIIAPGKEDDELSNLNLCHFANISNAPGSQER